MFGVINISRNKYPEETVKRILDVSLKLFLEKGYDNTSIQDIINNLGGLSKGAIYHHFKSKEDILYAVCSQYNQPVIDELNTIMHDRTLSGFGKLKKMYEISLSQSDDDIMFNVYPNMMENPKFLALEIQEIFETTAPHYVQPVIEEGIRDGSIKTDYPKELSEVIMLLTNIWLNPFCIRANNDEILGRVQFFGEILKKLGVEILDDKLLQSYKKYCNVRKEKEHKN